MDNPAAGAASAVKKVPKWAWIAGAGITGGVIFYRVTHKSANVDTAASNDATSPADYGQTYSPLGTVTATPVSDGSYAGAAPVAQGLQVSDIADLFGVIHQNDPPPVSAVDLLNSVLPYIGGGAPSSGAAAAPPAAPSAAPTPPAPPAARAVDKCVGAFPNDAGNGDCYRVDCNPPGHAKGRWHFHKNGQAQRVSPTC